MQGYQGPKDTGTRLPVGAERITAQTTINLPITSPVVDLRKYSIASGLWVPSRGGTKSEFYGKPDISGNVKEMQVEIDGKRENGLLLRLGYGNTPYVFGRDPALLDETHPSIGTHIGIKIQGNKTQLSARQGTIVYREVDGKGGFYIAKGSFLNGEFQSQVEGKYVVNNRRRLDAKPELVVDIEGGKRDTIANTLELLTTGTIRPDLLRGMFTHEARIRIAAKYAGRQSVLTIDPEGRDITLLYVEKLVEKSSQVASPGIPGKVSVAARPAAAVPPRIQASVDPAGTNAMVQQREERKLEGVIGLYFKTPPRITDNTIIRFTGNQQENAFIDPKTGYTMVLMPTQDISWVLLGSSEDIMQRSAIANNMPTPHFITLPQNSGQPFARYISGFHAAVRVRRKTNDSLDALVLNPQSYNDPQTNHPIRVMTETEYTHYRSEVAAARPEAASRGKVVGKQGTVSIPHRGYLVIGGYPPVEIQVYLPKGNEIASPEMTSAFGGAMVGGDIHSGRTVLRMMPTRK